MKRIILAVMTIVISAHAQATIMQKLKSLCEAHLVGKDPWPYADYTAQNLFDESQINLNDDLKREVVFRLDRMILDSSDKIILESIPHE